MKQIDNTEAPAVGGGYKQTPQGGCFPEPDTYPSWPLAPDPFPMPAPEPSPSPFPDEIIR